MADSILDYVKVVGRVALTVGDGSDEGKNPDLVAPDPGGTITFTPLAQFAKVADANPPVIIGNAVITCIVDTEGYLTYNGDRFVWLVDLGSTKVNPRIPLSTATYKVDFNLRFNNTKVSFPSFTCHPVTGVDNDITTLAPVPTGSGVPIIVGPTGTGVEDLSIEGGRLVVTLSDGDVVDAGELPVGPGGSNAGVASYIAAPGPTRDGILDSIDDTIEGSDYLPSAYARRMPGRLSSNTPLGMVRAALDAGMSTCVQTLSDSTGVTVIGTQKRWPYRLGEALAARYPAHTVQHQQWNDTTQAPDAVQTIQTGSAGIRGIDIGTQGAWLPATSILPTSPDLDVRVKVTFDAWPLAANGVLVCRGYTAGNFSFRMLVTSTGTVLVRSSADGTTNAFSSAFTLTGITAGTPVWIRMTHDDNNGSSARTITVYQSPDGVTWTQIGTNNHGGIGSLYASTQDWELGAEGFNGSILNGKIHDVVILDGIASTTVLSPRLIDDWRLRAESTATRVGSPVLLINNGAKSGADVLYLSDSTRLPKMIAKTSISACILSCSHNDGTKVGSELFGLWDTWLTRLRAALPVEAGIVVTTQNPETAAALTSGANPTAHATRSWQIPTWARKNGIGIVDAFRSFTEDPRGVAALLNPDGLHPSDAAGSPLWSDALVRASGF